LLPKLKLNISIAELELFIGISGSSNQQHLKNFKLARDALN
jgi:hypothetical protein